MSPAVTLVVAIAWGVFVLWLIGRNWTRRRPGSKRPRRRYGGAMTAGAIYDLLNEDRRKALEIIVEQRAEAHDPEDRDGNLPEIEDPRESG